MNKQSVKRQYLFVTGFARSGTTLLTNLLNSQSSAKVWSNFYGGPFVCAKRFGGFVNKLSPQARNVALSWHKFSLEQLDIQSEIKKDDFDTVWGLYKLGLDELAGENDKIVGHKINGFGPNTEVFRMALEETDLRIICVLRDIRDVVLSQSNHLHEKVTRCETWSLAAKKMRELAGHPRVAVVRYEDLVLEPFRAVEPVQDLLGLKIDFDLPFLLHHDAMWRDNSAFHDVGKLFDPRPVERWRRHTDNALVRRAAYSCRKEIERWGYPAFTEEHGFEEKAKYWSKKQMWRLWCYAARMKAGIRERLL